MRILRRKDGTFEARFTEPGWRCFSRIMSLYPRVPPAHHKATRGGLRPGDGNEIQTLLDEALAAQRQENKKAASAVLTDPARLKAVDHGRVLHLSAADAMCLLQVLNDIRVGSWILLGSPEDLDALPPNPEQEDDFYIMQIAGAYEHKLILAVGGGL